MLEPQVPQVITLADAQVDDPRLADIRQLNHPRLRPDRQARLEPVSYTHLTLPTNREV